MSSGILGANPDELRALAGRFGTLGTEIGESGTTCGAEVEGVRWVGLDADAFRGSFATTASLIAALSGALVDCAADLEAQAADQDAASAGTGAAGTGAADADSAADVAAAADSASAPTPISPADALAQVTPEELQRLSELNDPDAVAAYFAQLGYDPHDAAWQEAMAQLGRDHPALIGDLEGAPYVARDAANRALLDDAIMHEEQRLGCDDYVSEMASLQSQLVDAAASDDGIRALQINGRISELSTLGQLESLAAQTDLDGRQLAQFGVAENGVVLAAMSDRNLDIAEEVTVMVPGMLSDVNTIPELLRTGDTIRRDAEASGLDPSTHAILAWTNYDSPNLLEEAGTGRARDGGARLAGDLSGIQAARPDADVNIIAHSYGTTTANLALESTPDAFGVDQVVFLGSAGLTRPVGTPMTYESGLPDFDEPNYSYGGARLHASTSAEDNLAWAGSASPAHPVDPANPNAADGFTTFDTDARADATGNIGSTRHELEGDAVEPGYLAGSSSKAAVYIAGVIAHD